MAKKNIYKAITGASFLKYSGLDKPYDSGVKPLPEVTVTAKIPKTPNYSTPDFTPDYSSFNLNTPLDIQSATNSNKISPDFYSQMERKFPVSGQQPEEGAKKFNYGQAALMGLLAADALIPGQKPTREFVLPLDSYNPHPYGTGSQAIMKAGGKMPGGGTIKNRKPRSSNLKDHSKDKLGDGLTVAERNKQLADQYYELIEIEDAEKIDQEKKYAKSLKSRKPIPDLGKISIKDNRKVVKATGQPINPNRDLKSGQFDRRYIEEISQAARRAGVDPGTALAIALQESMIGQRGVGASNFGNSNLVNSDIWKDIEQHQQDVGYTDDSQVGASRLAYTLKDKLNYAKRLGIEDEVTQIQTYNGLGKIRFKGKFYGQNVEGVNLRDNPLYGNTIIDIRDNILKKNLDVNNILNGYYKGQVPSAPTEFTSFKDITKMPEGGPLDPLLEGNTPTSTPYNPTQEDLNNIRMAEMAASIMVEGGNPMQSDNAKHLFRMIDTQYGREKAQGFFTELSLFNQDKNNQQLSPQEKVKRFYEIKSPNSIKNQLNRYGYGPDNIYNTTTDISLQKQQGRGLLTSMDGGGSIKKLSENPFDGGTAEFVGPSHQNGGIDISYGNQSVEVEGQETATKSADGTLNIMGNMTVPGTKTKFKNVSKKLAKKENMYSQMLQKAGELQGADPSTDRGTLQNGTAKLLTKGAYAGLLDISRKKQLLVDLQNDLLNEASQKGIDPVSYSEGGKKKAKKGLSIGPDDPVKPSMAQRHNNPGNIKFSDFAKRYGAVKGEPATDGGNFAKFPDMQTGLRALKSLLRTKNYKDLPVEEALKRWTNGTGYKSIPLGDLKGKTISSLDPTEFKQLVDVITVGEDGKHYGDIEAPKIQQQAAPISVEEAVLPEVTVGPEASSPAPEFYESPNLNGVDLPELTPLPSNIRPMSLTQILPELFSAATNRPEPVPMQRFTPQLFSPYQVSLQDSRNNNQSTFSTLSRLVADNPAALGTLAAQKYGADNQVNAEEFRINQGISSDIYNKNIQILNDAQYKNLGLADRQYERQAQANSTTRAQNQLILNSIASKELQHSAANRKLALYENLYDFRFTDTNNDGIDDTATYMGPEAQLNFGPGTSGTSSQYAHQTVETDAQGNVRKTRTRYPSEKSQEEQDLRIRNRRFRMPLLPSLNLNFGG